MKRWDHRNCVGGRQISVIPPLLNTITLGGFTLNFFDSSKSQLRALATLRPFGGVSVKAHWSYLCHKLGSE